MYEVVMVWNLRDLKLGFSVFWRKSGFECLNLGSSRDLKLGFSGSRDLESYFRDQIWTSFKSRLPDFWRKSGCKKSHSNLFSSKIAWLTGTPEQILSSLFMHHHKEHWILHLSKTWIMSLSASFILRKVDHYSVFMRQTKKYIKKCHCRTSLSSSFINRSSWSEMRLILYGDISKHKGLRPGGDWTG